jgi:hypothetical protein
MKLPCRMIISIVGLILKRNSTVHRGKNRRL